MRRLRPHGLRPLRQAATARALLTADHIDNAVRLIDELDLGDVTLVAHDWGGRVGLGAVLINTWAWDLPSFVPPFIREFRTTGLGEILILGGNLFVESIPGGMANRETDPVMMDAYRAPFPGYWSRGGMLALQPEPVRRRDRCAGAAGPLVSGGRAARRGLDALHVAREHLDAEPVAEHHVEDHAAEALGDHPSVVDRRVDVGAADSAGLEEPLAHARVELARGELELLRPEQAGGGRARRLDHDRRDVV